MDDEWSPPTDEHEIPVGPDALSARRDAATTRAVVSASEIVDPVLGISEGDIRIVDAFFHELALDASTDPKPPSDEERAANARIAAEVERVKAMTPDELRAERARRLSGRRLRLQS